MLKFEYLRERRPNGHPFYDLADFADANEILIVRHENERRAADKARRDAEQESKSRLS